MTTNRLPDPLPPDAAPFDPEEFRRDMLTIRLDVPGVDMLTADLDDPDTRAAILDALTRREEAIDRDLVQLAREFRRQTRALKAAGLSQAEVLAAAVGDALPGETDVGAWERAVAACWRLPAPGEN
jgi:hypothetical protein